jgi:hypothetical protein
MPPPKKTPYQEFLDQPTIQALKASGPNANIRYEGTLSYQPSTYRNIRMGQRFAVSPASGGKALDVILTVERAQLRGESMSRWVVTHCDDANAPPDPNAAH